MNKIRYTSIKTELLFIALFLRLLKIGGRAAVIEPDGVLFGSSTAHKKMREVLVEYQTPTPSSDPLADFIGAVSHGSLATISEPKNQLFPTELKKSTPVRARGCFQTPQAFTSYA